MLNLLNVDWNSIVSDRIILKHDSFVKDVNEFIRYQFRLSDGNPEVLAIYDMKAGFQVDIHGEFYHTHSVVVIKKGVYANVLKMDGPGITSYGLYVISLRMFNRWRKDEWDFERVVRFKGKDRVMTIPFSFRMLSAAESVMREQEARFA